MNKPTQHEEAPNTVSHRSKRVKKPDCGVPRNEGRGFNHRLLQFTALFLLTYAVWLGLSLQFGHAYVEHLLPLYRWEINWLTPDYRIVSLTLADNRGEQVIALRLQLVRYIVVAGHVLPPGGSISSSTLTGAALQHVILMQSLLAAWPAKNTASRLVLMAMSLPWLMLVEMLDVPLVLLGSIDDLILANIAPDTGSNWVAWMNFMNGGGRLALTIVAALACVACRNWLAGCITNQQVALELQN